MGSDVTLAWEEGPGQIWYCRGRGYLSPAAGDEWRGRGMAGWVVARNAALGVLSAALGQRRMEVRSRAAAPALPARARAGSRSSTAGAGAGRKCVIFRWKQIPARFGAHGPRLPTEPGARAPARVPRGAHAARAPPLSRARGARGACAPRYHAPGGGKGRGRRRKKEQRVVTRASVSLGKARFPPLRHWRGRGVPRDHQGAPKGNPRPGPAAHAHLRCDLEK